MMREEQGHIEPGNKIEEEDSRDESVLGSDQIEDEGAGAGEDLPQSQAMLAQQFVLEKIIFRPVTAERFDQHSQNQQPAVNAVATPGQLRSRRMEGDHDPDPEPEEDRHQHDLAKQENAIQTLRALRNHDYFAKSMRRVRDGGPCSTCGKTGLAIRRYSDLNACFPNSYSHTKTPPAAHARKAIQDPPRFHHRSRPVVEEYRHSHTAGARLLSRRRDREMERRHYCRPPGSPLAG